MKNVRDIFWDDIQKTYSGNLQNKIAIITGGGKGIGKAIVENFLENGAKVIIVTRNSGKGLANTKPNCYYKSCDVRDYKRVKEVVEEVIKEFGKIDILVNAAGYAFLTPIKEESEDLFDKIMDINFKGVRNFMVGTIEYLEKSKGCIINIGSIWGLPDINLPGDSTYSAGDAAIIKYSEVAASEFKATRVNTISPALVDTEMNNDMTEEAKAEFIKGYKNRDTLLQPEEIAKVAEYIAKSSINKKNIIIDAGYMQRK